MIRFVTVVASVAALLALVVAPALAQTQTPTPSPAPRPAPGAPAADKPEAKEVEGTVKKVDPTTKSLQVSSGLLGLFGATLEVNEQTKITVDGKDGALSDIREGAKVKASYESRNGKNVAKAIDVMPAEEKATSGAPARPAPSTGSSSPSTSPSTPPASQPPASQPKTQ